MPIIGQSPLLGLTPWIIYWLVAGSSNTWVWGGVCALIASVLLGVSIGRGAPKMLDVVTLVFFVTVTIAGSVVGAGDRNWLDTYAMAHSSGVLAVLVLGSRFIAPFTGPPFTWQYIRNFAPRNVWRQPAFDSTDGVLTLMWCLVFTVIAVLGFVSATALSISNWITCAISVALIAAAIEVTQRVSSGRVAISGRVAMPAPWATRPSWEPIDRSASPVLGRSYAAEPKGGGVVHRIPSRCIKRAELSVPHTAQPQLGANMGSHQRSRICRPRLRCGLRARQDRYIPRRGGARRLRHSPQYIVP